MSSMQIETGWYQSSGLRYPGVSRIPLPGIGVRAGVLHMG